MFVLVGNILETGKEIYRRQFEGIDLCLDPLRICFGDHVSAEEEITHWIEPPRSFTKRTIGLGPW
ncbi:MAG: hypothetical protein HYU99_08805 [Deltaproteobacteria bacterium]|nr:hypothetical protein [Deltaproteobacteria bacterium]